MSTHFQFLLLLCALCSEFAKTGDVFKIYQPLITKPERTYGQKIVFPTEAGSSYKALFEPYQPVTPKWYNRKITKFGKPTHLKIKPFFVNSFNPSGVQNIPTYPPGPVDKDVLYKLTRDILQQTRFSLNNKYNSNNDGLHDPGIRPVVEHIEGDLKYDFRTKTHSYDK